MPLELPPEPAAFAALLLQVAEQGDHTSLSFLLENIPATIPVDVRNSSHFTPFILAARTGSITHWFIM